MQRFAHIHTTPPLRTPFANQYVFDVVLFATLLVVASGVYSRGLKLWHWLSSVTRLIVVIPLMIIFTLLFLYPLLGVTNLILWLVYRRDWKTIDQSNYHRVRKYYDNTKQPAETLRLPAAADLRPYPWYVRFSYRPLRSVSRSMLMYRDKLGARLELLDQPYTDVPAGLQIVGGDELWTRRAKKYEYLI